MIGAQWHQFYLFTYMIPIFISVSHRITSYNLKRHDISRSVKKRGIASTPKEEEKKKKRDKGGKKTIRKTSPYILVPPYPALDFSFFCLESSVS